MGYDQLLEFGLNATIAGTALVCLAKWTAKRIETSEIASLQREASLSQEVKDLRKEQRSLEKEIRNDLVGLLKETKVALDRSTTTNQQVTKILHALTNRMSDGIGERQGASRQSGEESQEQAG